MGLSWSPDTEREQDVATIVGVHGAFHQLWGPWEVRNRWAPAIRDGLWQAGCDFDPADDMQMAFYGDIFRANVDDGRPSDEELLEVARDAGLTEVMEELAGPDGLEVIANAVGKQSLRQLINQLGRYFADDDLRHAVQRRMTAVMTPDTRVVVAHSMGTVVAYEVLCAHPEWNVDLLLTIGSPLGGEWVFGQLRPPPEDDLGSWPGSVGRWVNIASVGDRVCEEPELHTASASGSSTSPSTTGIGHTTPSPTSMPR